MSTRITGLVALAAVFGSAAAAGTIISPNAIDLKTFGFGVVTPILALQPTAGGTMESGCVAPDGSGNASLNCDAWNGEYTTIYSTATLRSLDLNRFSDLFLMLNLSEPDRTLTIESLTLGLFSVTNGKSVLVDSFSLATPQTLTLVASGVATGDYAFRISGASAPFSGDYYIGLSATISGVSDGAEAFRVVSSPVADAPTAFLIGAGLISIGALARRRMAH